MAHKHQLNFVKTLSSNLAKSYFDKDIIEIGSYDVNGHIRSFFNSKSYLGVDLTNGPNVDLVFDASELNHSDSTYDMSISCECFEHNPKWLKTFLNMIRMTKEGGVVIFSCATKGRLEHGTSRTSPLVSPGTYAVGWNYYLNLTERDFKKHVNLDNYFDSYFFMVNKYESDLYFAGIKRGKPLFNFNIELLKYAISLSAKNTELEIRQSYPYSWFVKLLHFVYLQPIKIASLLPERLFQNFSLVYIKILSIPKEFIRRIYTSVH